MQGETYQLIGSEVQIQQPLLAFQIDGRPAFSYVNINVEPNKKVLADGESMLWMDGSLDIETSCYGGCFAGFLRTCAGESCCMNHYSGAGELTLGFDMPGDMLCFAVTPGHGWMLRATAFVGGTDNISVSGKFSGCLPCLCTDQGLFLTTISLDSGDCGIFFAGSYGMLERHDIPEGKSMIVSHGNFFAGHSSRTLDMTMIGGLKNCCCGAGFGALGFKFNGPCTIYTQSRNPMDLRRMQMRAQEKQKREQEAGQEAAEGIADAVM